MLRLPGPPVDILLPLAAGGAVAVLHVGWVAATRRWLDCLAAFVAGTFVLAQLDARWCTQPAFRRQFVMLSAVIGTVLLAEATARVVLIYLLLVDVMAVVSTALHVGTLGLLACWLLWYRGRRQRELFAAWGAVRR